MMNFQANYIPSFGYSMTMPGDMATVDRDMFDHHMFDHMFDHLPEMQLASPALPAVRTTAKKSTTKRPPAKKAAPTKHKITSKKRASRSRRVIPDVKTYIAESEPKDSDVVCGRGGRSNHHPGNKACYLVMFGRRAEYRACGTDTEKTKIAQEVVDFVHNQNGRYVQLDRETGRWFILPLKIALDKAKQGLRDKYIPYSMNGDDTGAKRSTPKKSCIKKQSKKTPPTTTKPSQDKLGDEVREAISSDLPFFKSNEENPLKLSPGHSLDDLFPLFPLPNLSISNSFILGTEESLCAVEKLLRSNDSILQTGCWGNFNSSQGDCWNVMFAKGINPMIDYEAV
jgi:hypothetical protein